MIEAKGPSSQYANRAKLWDVGTISKEETLRLLRRKELRSAGESRRDVGERGRKGQNVPNLARSSLSLEKRLERLHATLVRHSHDSLH